MVEREGYIQQNFPQPSLIQTPPGLEAIYGVCRCLYPEQPNPLQVTAVLKYWLGGPDPLDYISMYANPGNSDLGVPPHWHYISFGLSDLHGDGRVHEFTGSDGPSGFGFELTFRLKREQEETAPPTWPAALMQALARYVFQSENNLCSGDHVSWHCPLDNSESRIQHMLMIDDPQMPMVTTPFGSVSFVQIVGVCKEELQAAQHWNGPGVLNLFKTVPVAGGVWLVTDMRRGESIFEIDPLLQETLDHGIETEGSNLSGVGARCSWEAWKENHDSPDFEEEENSNSRSIRRISDLESEQIKSALKFGLLNVKPVLPPIRNRNNVQEKKDDYSNSLQTDNNQNNERKESYDSTSSESALEMGELLQTRTLGAVHLKFNLEAGTLLPLALRGRLKHGRHFTFKSVLGDVAITFVNPSVLGSFVDQDHPFAAHGPWLQVLITEDFLEQMIKDFDCLSNKEEMFSLPKIFSWPNQKLMITIFGDDFC